MSRSTTVSFFACHFICYISIISSSLSPQTFFFLIYFYLPLLLHWMLINSCWGECSVVDDNDGDNRVTLDSSINLKSATIFELCVYDSLIFMTIIKSHLTPPLLRYRVWILHISMPSDKFGSQCHRHEAVFLW